MVMVLTFALMLLAAATSFAANASSSAPAATGPAGSVAPKPLFRDPVHDGAADPVVIWNRAEKKWFMLYTNRRANVPNTPGVSWVHGTKIGIAESTDNGATWTYRGTADIDRGGPDDSHWAPDVLYHDGTYHMYLSFVPGMHTDWSGTRDILHLTSSDLLKWKYQSTLKLASDRVIDASVFRLPDGTWRMWYNNERDKKSIYFADSKDLHAWTDGGKAIGDQPGEGPKVFKWKDRHWMIVDVWNGMGVYSSDDLKSWKRQPKDLISGPGKGEDDNVEGRHADVVVSGDRAYLFYFTHPGWTENKKRQDVVEQRRSSIQVVELGLVDGQLVADRTQPTHVDLRPPTDEARAVSDASFAIKPTTAPATSPTTTTSTAAGTGPYLLTYFVGNGEDGLHLASSSDGLAWEPLKGGKSFLTPTVGESKLMRDPCVVRGPDGTYHMVWTTAWKGKTIGYASSKDFVNWSEQRAIPVMGHERNVINCWAPEIVYDDARQQYVIFWASTIPGKFAETQGSSEERYNHRMYYTTTKDFKAFAPTKLFYDPGFSVIDATFVHGPDGPYLIVKDETRNPPKKHLRIARAQSLEGPFGELSPPFTPDWVEGPTALKVGDDYLCYYDVYTKHHYGAMRSRDLKKWEDVTKQLKFPKGARHGTVIEVPQDVIDRLKQE